MSAEPVLSPMASSNTAVNTVNKLLGRTIAVVALQPRNQPGTQKRRLAAARRPAHHKQRLSPRRLRE